MNDEMRYFIVDFIQILRDKYKDSLVEPSEESESDKSFRLGTKFAYYDCLDILEQQLRNFGFDVDELGEISPKLE